MALEVRRLGPEEHRIVPWRNGAGSTAEVALWPPGSRFEDGDFAWRLSLAGVARPGPFSSFPDHERLLVVLEGGGLVVDHGPVAPARRIAPLEPYRFDGAWPTHASPLGGAVRDIGLLAERGVFTPSAEVLRLGARRWRADLAAGHGLVYVANGALRARVTGEEEAFELERGDTLWLAELAGHEELELAGRRDDTLAILFTLLPTEESDP